jgi:hypothetical protein
MRTNHFYGRIAAMSRSPRFAPTVRPLDRLGLVGVLLLAVFALSGCFAVEMNAKVDKDNTVSGTAKIGVSKSLAALAGGSDSLLSDLKSDDPCTFGSTKGVSKDYDDGTFVGVECTFENISFPDFNDGQGGPKISRDGDTFRLTGSFDTQDAVSGSTGTGSASSSASSTPGAPPSLPSGFPTSLPSDLSSLLPSGFPSGLRSLFPSGLPSGIPTNLPSSGSGAFPTDLPGLDAAAILKTAKINFEFTFPGKVKSSKGQVTGNTVTFKPDSSGKIDFQTVADAKSSGSATSGSIRWIGIGAGLFVLVAIAALLLKRRNRTPAVAGGPDGFGGYPQVGVGYGQPYPAPDQGYQQTLVYPTQHPALPVQRPPYSGPPTQPQYREQQYPTQPNPQPPDDGYYPPPA